MGSNFNKLVRFVASLEQTSSWLSCFLFANYYRMMQQVRVGRRIEARRVIWLFPNSRLPSWLMGNPREVSCQKGKKWEFPPRILKAVIGVTAAAHRLGLFFHHNSRNYSHESTQWIHKKPPAHWFGSVTFTILPFQCTKVGILFS